MSSDLLHSSFISVFEATYFFALLIPAAMGSSSVFTYGQCAANISYVFLPSNNQKDDQFARPSPCRGSDQSRENPPAVFKTAGGSSSGPPGAYITPSRVMKDMTTSFLILFFSRVCPLKSLYIEFLHFEERSGPPRQFLRVFVFHHLAQSGGDNLPRKA